MRDLPGEAAETGRLAGCFPVQSDHAYWLFNLVAGDSDRFDEIRVLRENNSLIEQPAPCIVNELGCEIDVRAFLFTVLNENVGRAVRDRLDERPHLGPGQEAAQMNGNARKGSRSIEVALLANRLPRIALAAYRRGEVADAKYLVILAEKRYRECLQVQPFESGIPQRPVLEIEAVDVNVGSQAYGHSRSLHAKAAGACAQTALELATPCGPTSGYELIKQ